MNVLFEHLREWIDREEHGCQTLSPDLVRQFNATFDRESDCSPGAKAPVMIHFCLTQPTVPSVQLSEDGHPARGGFLPPVPLPRRMWAGGMLTFSAPLKVGDMVERRSRISDISLKEGRSGQLCFVTVDHVFSCEGREILTERQDIVYRDWARTEPTSAGSSRAASPGCHSRVIVPEPALLFRYSALTFNAHRIHYDENYSKGVEGYPGRVVHGPLQASLLCQYANDLRGASPKHFEFRSRAPVFDTSEFTINASETDEGLRLWTAQTGGEVAMEALAQW